MNVFGHDHKRVYFESTFTPVPIHSYEKEAHVIFDDKESASLPRGERYEISSGRKDESSRFQEQTSAAKAAIFDQPKSARVKLVPFPVVFSCKGFVLEQN